MCKIYERSEYTYIGNKFKEVKVMMYRIIDSLK